MISDRDQTQAAIEARLSQLGQTITTLRMKAEQQHDKYAAPLGETLDAIEGKRDEVKGRLQEINALDEDVWSHTVAKLNSHLDDIDTGLRSALAHFK